MGGKYRLLPFNSKYLLLATLALFSCLGNQAELSRMKYDHLGASVITTVRKYGKQQQANGSHKQGLNKKAADFCKQANQTLAQFEKTSLS